MNLHYLKLELVTINRNTILNNQNYCKLYTTLIDILTINIFPFVNKKI